MSFRLTLEFFGERQLDRTLDAIDARLHNMRPAWDALADRFAEVERRQFDSEGKYGSGGWKPLSPAYAAWKARRYPGKPILEREGDLRRSLTVRPFPVERFGRLDAEFGSDVPYGAFHQRGSGRLPQRRPVELPTSTREEWAKLLQRYVRTGTIGGAGSGVRARTGGR